MFEERLPLTMKRNRNNFKFSVFLLLPSNYTQASFIQNKPNVYLLFSKNGNDLVFSPKKGKDIHRPSIIVY